MLRLESGDAVDYLNRLVRMQSSLSVTPPSKMPMIIPFLIFGRLPAGKILFLFLLLSLTLPAAPPLGAAEKSADAPTPEQQEAARQEERKKIKLAVALNYCRAAFHRINRSPTAQVLYEEQQRILNNLDLSSIDDVQVVKLYTDVIDEIGQIEMIAREKVIIDDHHKRVFRQKLFLNAMALGTHVATFNTVGAIQTGAGSWWDYRSSSWGRVNDTWKLEKGHLSALVRKTTHFIETSWKLAREREIPDKWLIRDRDLDKLEETLSESNLEVRLRMLKRMEPYYRCYPPFYYYVGRIEQSLGRLHDARETFRTLRDLEGGHFRQDDMLAAGLASLASIEHHLGDRQALETAKLALMQSNEVWEANLICASILCQYGEFVPAEDAVLRNLDVDLELDASRNALVLLYAQSGDTAKLASRLSDDDFVKSLRGPVLLTCAMAMGDQGLPSNANRQLLASLHGRVHMTYGRDDLIITASEDWNLATANLQVSYAGVSLGKPEILPIKEGVQLVYRGVLEVGTPWKQTRGTRPISLEAQFEDQPAIAFNLVPVGTQAANNVLQVAGISELPGTERQGYLLANVRSPNYLVAFDGTPTRKYEPGNPDGNFLAKERPRARPQPVPDYRKFDALPARTGPTPDTNPLTNDASNPLVERRDAAIPDEAAPAQQGFFSPGTTSSQGPIQLMLPE
jgi:hypothetical protein